ncbi:MAG TPA: LysR family transcriptional regulator [Devosia sp.]|nr:LysR family transcriptional regulator [Devosia sp.]
MDITLKQLEIFQAVVVAGSITKASRRLGLSQPSISQQLAKLEEKLGSQLIQRNRSRVISLTPAGEYWFKSGDDLLRRLEGIVDEHTQRFLDSGVYVRMGVTPTLRGRFAAAAGRIASQQPGFVRFDLNFALTSAELVEQLRLHQINFAIINRDAIEEDRGSFHIAELFEDPIAWVVPADVPAEAARQAVQRKGVSKPLPPALNNYVEVAASVSLRMQTDEWYRHRLPDATAAFSTNTYATAVDLVAAGLATCHSPLSLMPNLDSVTRSRIQVFPIPGLARMAVLGMPRHLYTLASYANVFRHIVEFCRTEYRREMMLGDLLPLASGEREPGPPPRSSEVRIDDSASRTSA